MLADRGSEKVSASPDSKASEQQRAARALPAKPRQHDLQRIMQPRQLQLTSSQGSGSNPSGRHPSGRQSTQQRIDAPNRMMAIGKGSIAVEMGVPHQGVGCRPRRHRHSLLQVQQLAEGGDAGSRKVEECRINAVLVHGGAEEGIAPQRGRPAPVAKGDRGLCHICGSRQTWL
jgi:hypothetical protein